VANGEGKLLSQRESLHYKVGYTKSGQVHYLFGDHLGSTSLVVDGAGRVVSEVRYRPWGEERYNRGAPSTRYTYTGQYSHLAEFGLYFYNARWYSPTLGRFTQPDSLIPVQSQGAQAWDRYAYVNNNPVRYNDPTGHIVNPPCWLCDVTWLTYTNVSGIWNNFIDITATVGCFFVGCHVDTKNDTISGPTKAEAMNAAILGLVNPIKMPDAGFSSAAVNALDDEIYSGVRKASQFLQDIGVPREVRKQVIESFDIRTINVRPAREAEYGIRYFDDVNALPKGRWLFPTFPASRETLAIRPEWNAMTRFKQWQIRPGSILIEGRVAPQGPYLPGGGWQIYVPFLSDIWEVVR